MSKQFNKVKLSITLDIEVHEYVQKLAEDDDRSLSQQINKILRDFIKEKESK